MQPVPPVQTPLELPRLVMRGALVVVLGALLLALLVGLWRAREDMRDELSGALAQAEMSALLIAANTIDDEQLVAAVRSLRDAGGSRHLDVRLLDGAGRVRLEPRPEQPASAVLGVLVQLNRVLFAPPRAQTVAAVLPRPDGPAWQVQWIASHNSEQREKLVQLVEMLSLLAGCGLVMLLVMHWRVRRSFRALAPLLSAIAGVERQDLSAVRALPAMPIRELDVIAHALRHLAVALEQAETRRRVLGTQVLTLQEDERSRLARELHDELGQHLTALRVDASWLQRRLAHEPELAAVVAGMSEQCSRIQNEVRALLTRLRPLGTADASQPDGGESVGRLRVLLETLVQAWVQSPGQTTRYALAFECTGFDADDRLPRELVLTVYRISQEALTNVARHARARQARLSVRIERTAGAPSALLEWSVEDDGCGLDHPGAWQRGNGLAGVKDRVWSAGGDLEWQPATAAADGRPGLKLHARLPFAAIGQESVS
ncbi:sensor histidine kinase [Methylibium sp.]|uniref:sensor histidine kinase n=1 Tax=Methylibium sp. TaxID=2067992 RepID=UPI003D0E68DC